MRIAAGILILGIFGSEAIVAGGEIHGTIETTGGEVLTGPIRWDNNENYWDDILDAVKTEPTEPHDEEDGFKLSLFGWELLNTKPPQRNYRQFSVPFGHLASLEPDGASAAVIELKNGERVRVSGSTSDLGNGLELMIADKERGPVELAWYRIARIEFSQNSGAGRDDQRLYGTVKTRSGSLRGFVVWDRDESLREDILDGEQDGRDHEVPFGEIKSIEPLGSFGARVKLKSSDELELRGTNDVNDDNRGVVVTVAGIGSVEVPWGELEKVSFEAPPPSPRYEAFDGGQRLRGSVSAKDGGVYSGAITWDMDEQHTWESLDGEADNLDYAVRFENIVSINPAGSHAAEVRLANDDVLRLTGSNDVGEGNRGIMVTAADGSETLLAWEEIELVRFD